MSDTNNNPQAKIFGLTIDSIDEHNVNQIIELLNEFKTPGNSNLRPTVRIVFDVGDDPEEFNRQYEPEMIVRLKNEANVFLVGEILDSFDVHWCVKSALPIEESIKSYETRTRAYLKELGGLIDIWEIGNEVNGEWTGWIEDPSENKAVTAEEMQKVRDTVARQSKAAHEIIRQFGKPTALTLYFNDDGDGQTSYSEELKREKTGSDKWVKFGVEHSMFKWIETYKDYFPTVDYVLISYYEDDNFYRDAQGNRHPITPTAEQWARIFKRLKNSFSGKTKFGFGEVGPQCHYRREDTSECRVLDIYNKDSTDSSKNNCTRKNDPKWNVRRCHCCLEAQKKYIIRYYSDCDKKILDALQKADADLAKNYVGGYFYWHYNDDVINKFVYAEDTDIDEKIRRKLKAEAEKTQSVLVNAFNDWHG